MGERQRDLAWEALVRETSANPAMERGQLNTALRAIREAAFSEGLTEDGLPEEIRLRADAYRRMWPMLTLTPTALAKHSTGHLSSSGGARGRLPAHRFGESAVPAQAAAVQWLPQARYFGDARAS